MRIGWDVAPALVSIDADSVVVQLDSTRWGALRQSQRPFRPRAAGLGVAYPAGPQPAPPIGGGLAVRLALRL